MAWIITLCSMIMVGLDYLTLQCLCSDKRKCCRWMVLLGIIDTLPASIGAPTFLLSVDNSIVLQKAYEWGCFVYMILGVARQPINLALLLGKCVDIPDYDFCIHTRKSDTIHVTPTPVIIVDGILTFHDERLRELFDVKIFADADADERILRRLRRDVTERGRDIDGVINQYVGTVKIMHGIYVEPTKKYADIIINGGRNQTALDIMATRIQKRLSQKE